MTEPLEFVVFMTPIGKGRPRFGNGHVYTPQETVMFESAFRAMSRKYKPIEPISVPIDLEIEFNFIKPRTTKRKFHSVKPDIDNLIKAVCDSCNKVFFIDDSQIVRVRATKFYSEKECIRVVIKEFSEETI